MSCSRKCCAKCRNCKRSAICRCSPEAGFAASCCGRLLTANDLAIRPGADRGRLLALAHAPRQYPHLAPEQAPALRVSFGGALPAAVGAGGAHRAPPAGEKFFGEGMRGHPPPQRLMRASVRKKSLP